MSLRQAKLIRQVKDSFFNICAQYEQMAKLYNLQAHALTKAEQLEGPVAEALRLVLEQHQQIGEEMKTLGISIDLLGGEPVYQKKERQGPRMITGTPNELKKMGIKLKVKRGPDDDL